MTGVEVAVGSTNPVKLDAARAAASDVFDDASVTGVAVDSGVSEMPDSHEEARQGARHRAERALKRSSHDVGLGPEGYVIDIDGTLYLSNWVVAVDADGTRGEGGGALVALPERIADRIRGGEELGPVIDEEVGRDGISEAEGTFGVLTDGRYTRQRAFADAVHCALTPLVQDTFYGGDSQ